LLSLENFEGWGAPQIVEWAVSSYGSRFAIATSFQKEGMVIVDLAARAGKPFRVFTLDTFRLPEETYRMIESVEQRYGVSVEVVSPDAAEVEDMIRRHGRDLFYESVEMRQLCCETRKVRPLERKLRELDAWATGLRRGQSETRAAIAKVENSEGRIKISPLADWTAEQVEDYTRAFGVPVHPLYERGYHSIGCAPCTRSVVAGEDPRAGRWWWEQDAKKECGIHFGPDGTVRRAS
jgi:thioredoxin-dependent adenylylsulfate APS reductase